MLSGVETKNIQLRKKLNVFLIKKKLNTKQDVKDEVQMEVWINFLDSDTLKDSVMRGFEEYVDS